MLTARKIKFVDEYLATGNASLSARNAGYCPKHPENASFYASTLINKDKEVIELLETKRKVLQEVIKKEREELYPAKDSYIKRTFEKAESVTHPPTASKYWELGGKALGYLSDDKQNEAPMLQIVIHELNLSFTPSRCKRLTTGSTSKTVQQEHALVFNDMNNPNDMYTVSDNKGTVDTVKVTTFSLDTVSQDNIPRLPVGGEGPSQGANLSLIPLPKISTVLNLPSNETINSKEGA